MDTVPIPVTRPELVREIRRARAENRFLIGLAVLAFVLVTFLA